MSSLSTAACSGLVVAAAPPNRSRRETNLFAASAAAGRSTNLLASQTQRQKCVLFGKSARLLAVRVGPILILPPFLFVSACGGVSTRNDPGGASTDAGGACAEPASVVPDLPPFQPPPSGGLPAFHVTLHNRCAQTLWPAYGSSGGLDQSVIDTQLWLPMSPASDRTITVYGGVREIGFWGRTGCNFDQEGNGTCETGECGNLICPISVNSFPKSTTIFGLEEGFHGGYNVGLRVEGVSCGNHECTANLDSCDDGSVAKNACGGTIACSDICAASTACCTRPGCNSSGVSHGDATDDIVVTFCP
jgi:Thaumatin family